MTKMKLYYSPGSPYARKVRIVAMETKLDKKMRRKGWHLLIGENIAREEHNWQHH
jgi:glutathione S-transferase